MSETQTAASGTVRKISRTELKAKLDGKAHLYLWDTRTAQYFTKEVIEGAKWVPVDKLEGELSNLGAQKNDEIVVYCSSTTCPASKTAANLLTKLGYKNVSAYEEGLADWKEAGLPTSQAA